MENLDLATCVMLTSMAPDLQKQHEAMNAQDIILNLRELFSKENRIERFNIFKELFRSKMFEDSLVRPHMLTKIGFITQLEQLGWTMDHDLSTDLVFTSLLKSYSQFVLNFNMNKIETTLSGLLNMLTQAEKTIVKKNLQSILSLQRKGLSKRRKRPRKTRKMKEPFLRS